MLLFRYFASHAFQTIRDLQLMVSRISGFNDPFEFMYRPTGTMTREKARDYVSTDRYLNFAADRFQGRNSHLSRKKALRMAKARIPLFAKSLIENFDSLRDSSIERREEMVDRSIRVSCFANAEEVNSLDEILMWSHYAKKHEGFRIGFEFPSDKVLPFKVVEVNYSDKRVPLDLSMLANETEAFEQALMECNKTKSRAWSYEREFRLFTHPKFCVRGKDLQSGALDFVDLERSWIRRVDFGIRTPINERKAIFDLISSGDFQIECCQAKYHRSDYALEYDPVVTVD